MREVKAREIVGKKAIICFARRAGFKTVRDFYEAKGYLEHLGKTKGLVEALKKIHSVKQGCGCQVSNNYGCRCFEGDGFKIALDRVLDIADESITQYEREK